MFTLPPDARATPPRRCARCITPSSNYLDDPAEDLDRAAVVRALNALTRRRKGKDGKAAGKARGAAITGRTAAYGLDRALHERLPNAPGTQADTTLILLIGRR